MTSTEARPFLPSLLLCVLAALAVSSRATGEPGDPAAALRLLKTNCFSCHNAKKQKGGLVMTSREAILRGGESGPALVAGAPEESALIAALAPGADPHMPPRKQLDAAQIETLHAWIQAGAVWDAAALVDPPRTPRAVTLSALPAMFRPVLALALSPDGTRLAVGCGNELLICGVAAKSLTIVARAASHPDPVQAIAWSPDGQRLATGAFRRVVIWETSSWSPERHLVAGLTDRITALRFLPDGHRLALADGSAAEEGTVRLADLASGGMIASWLAHEDTIFDLAVSADGEFLATAGGDKFVKIWQLATHLESARIEASAAQVLTLAFNADATQLVTGGSDQQIKVWDVKTKDRLMTLGRHNAAINAVAWSAHGPALFAATEAGKLLRYTKLKMHTGAEGSDSGNEQNLEAAKGAIYALTASADGRVFAGTHDGRVIGWDKDGKLVARLDLAPATTTASTTK